MNFEETLNYYIDKINCTSKQLADASHISQSVISRYRKGDRTPKYNSIQANAIKDGLISLAKKNKIDIDENKLKEEFDNTLNSGNIDFNTFKDNFNKLIDILNINVKSISKYIGFDASYLSKIRNGIMYIISVNIFRIGIRGKTIRIFFSEIKDLTDAEKYLLLNCPGLLKPLVKSKI